MNSEELPLIPFGAHQESDWNERAQYTPRAAYCISCAFYNMARDPKLTLRILPQMDIEFTEQSQMLLYDCSAKLAMMLRLKFKIDHPHYINLLVDVFNEEGTYFINGECLWGSFNDLVQGSYRQVPMPPSLFVSHVYDWLGGSVPDTTKRAVELMRIV